MKKILSCDWGTSSFRLRLVDTETLEPIAEENNSQGTAGMYAFWQKTGKADSERLPFYYDFIGSCIKSMEQKIACSLDNIPLVISGMASSSIGMMELPYKETPFLTDGSDLEIKIIGADGKFGRKIMIISGVRTGDDVMRGEETKLAGSIVKPAAGTRFFILPGTHPKHVRTRNSEVVGFTTYMTGEYFDLLSTKSILSGSIEPGGDFNLESHKQYFIKGVNDSMQTNLLHSSFLVRTNALFEKCTKQENYFYLSGLLIGTELKDLSGNTRSGITLLGDRKLNALYLVACNTMNISLEGIENADDALIRGQVRISSSLMKMFL